MNSKRDFEVLKERGRTPTLAVCRKCEVKFFTPRELLEFPDEAGSYLANKFDLHRCPLDTSRDRDEKLIRSALFGTEYTEDGLRNWPKHKIPRRRSA